MPAFDFWDYVIFDLERYLNYTEKYIRHNLYIEEVIAKWVMVVNQEHLDQQADIALRIALAPNQKEGYKHKQAPIPFPAIENIVKEKAFDRAKAWEEAPEYDLGNIKNQLNNFK